MADPKVNPIKWRVALPVVGTYIYEVTASDADEAETKARDAFEDGSDGVDQQLKEAPIACEIKAIG